MDDIEELELSTDDSVNLDPENKFDVLPTGKKHVSFSEVKDWIECSFRHKLKQVDQINLDEFGIHADFGTAAHETLEHYLLTRMLDLKIFKRKLYELWKEKENVEAYSTKQFVQFVLEGSELLKEFPEWFDKEFPGWETIDAEHLLYEQIGELPHAFKGYIDCIIKVPYKNDFKYWIIDFKTCAWGWKTSKKSDPSVRMQTILYKNFWSIKSSIDPKKIVCAFLLLKRTAKSGKKFEVIKVSAGPVATKKSLKVVNNMISSVKKGIAIKNRSSCQYCKYFETTHCT